MTSKIQNKYENLAHDYLYASELLLKGYKDNYISIDSDKCRPFFSLLGHACECCLKALAIKELNLSEGDLKKYRHDLVALKKELESIISDEMQELIFYIASSHYANDGKSTSYYNRYDDNKFDDNEERKRREALLKKQKENGFSSEKPIYIGLATDDHKSKLEPELSSYSKYLFSTTIMRPKPEFAISVIKEELKKLTQSNTSGSSLDNQERAEC